jgi:hypothetical protein
MSKLEASYTKSIGPDGVRFKIVPGSSPDAGFSLARLLLCAVPAYIFAAIVAGLFGQVIFSVVGVFGETLGKLAAFLVMVAVAVAFFYGWFKCYRWFNAWYLRKQGAGRHAYDAELLVNAAGLTVLGTKQFLRSDDIHRLVIKNAFDDSVEMPLSGYVAVGSPMAVGAAAAANAMTNTVAILANNKRRAMARISYFVTIEAGGVSHKIAGGLTEVCAHGVMTDIGRALRSEIA